MSASSNQCECPDPWMTRIFQEGCDANDHNKRALRNSSMRWISNPYPVDSVEHLRWQQGYCYRSMVNDG